MSTIITDAVGVELATILDAEVDELPTFLASIDAEELSTKEGGLIITPYPSPDTITPQVMHVEAVDLAPIIQRMYSHLGKGGIITAKMDIEGDEFALLPHLERSQALCLISRIQILWHPQYYDEKEGRKAAAALGLEADVSGAKASEASVRQMQLQINEIYAHPTGECKAWLQEKQDITYEQDDGNDDDWPQGACKSELD